MKSKLGKLHEHPVPRSLNLIGKFPLIGFESDLKEIRLDEAHLIRKATEDEYESISRRIEIQNHKSFRYLLIYSYNSKTAITYPSEILNHLEILNIFFRVYKSCPIGIVYCNHYLIDENSDEKSIGFISDPRLYFSSEKTFKLDQTEELYFIKFWKCFFKMYLSKNQSFKISISRFYFSFLRFDPDDKLIDLVIALEGLFVKKEKAIAKLLAERVSRFVNKDFGEISIYDLVFDAYKRRSKYVHGDIFKEESSDESKIYKKKKAINNLLINVLENCLHRYISEYSDESKEELITYIEGI